MDEQPDGFFFLAGKWSSYILYCIYGDYLGKSKKKKIKCYQYITRLIVSSACACVSRKILLRKKITQFQQKKNLIKNQSHNYRWWQYGGYHFIFSHFEWMTKKFFFLFIYLQYDKRKLKSKTEKNSIHQYKRLSSSSSSSNKLIVERKFIRLFSHWSCMYVCVCDISIRNYEKKFQILLLTVTRERERNGNTWKTCYYLHHKLTRTYSPSSLTIYRKRHKQERRERKKKIKNRLNNIGKKTGLKMYIKI